MDLCQPNTCNHLLTPSIRTHEHLSQHNRYELKPCQTLIDIGTDLFNDALYKDIPAWTETKRDFADIFKRKGELPTQLEADQVSIRDV